MSEKLDINIRYGRGKTQAFEIYTVPNRFNYLYPLYFKDILDQQEMMQDNASDLSKIDTEDNVSWMKGTLEKKYELVKALLKANEYEFDREFWEEKANPSDINDMISACTLKDITEEDKKKIVKMISR